LEKNQWTCSCDIFIFSRDVLIITGLIKSNLKKKHDEITNLYPEKKTLKLMSKGFFILFTFLNIIK
jgi:hypothetical protein